MTEHADRGTVLVDIAREAIGERLGLAAARHRDEPWLAHPAATFVTALSGGLLPSRSDSPAVPAGGV